MKHLLTMLLLVPAMCLAQLPADFQHQLGTMKILATPVDGGGQVLDSAGTLKVNLGTGRYTVTVYTSSANTFERYMKFSTLEADTVDTRSQGGINLELITSQCLVLIPRDAEDVGGSPTIKDGAGTQIVMYQTAKYWYCYVRQTKVNQKFSYNPTNTYAGDVSFYPMPGKVILWRGVLNKTVSINVSDPFK